MGAVDNDLAEILDDFIEETTSLCEQMEHHLEKAEDDPGEASRNLEQFGLLIDRVMGTAKSLGLSRLGSFCELGKTIGYKSSQIQDKETQEITVGVLFDGLDVLKESLQSLKNSPDGDLFETPQAKALLSRLKWLSEKFSHIERGSVAYDEDKESSEKSSKEEIDALLKDFGF